MGFVQCVGGLGRSAWDKASEYGSNAVQLVKDNGKALAIAVATAVGGAVLTVGPAVQEVCAQVTVPPEMEAEGIADSILAAWGPAIPAIVSIVVAIAVVGLVISYGKGRGLRR